MTLESLNSPLKNISSDCFKTKNSSLGLVCKRFQEISKKSTYMDSLSIVSLLICQVNNMMNSDCNEVEINFNNVLHNNIAIYGECKINMELKIVGATESEDFSLSSFKTKVNEDSFLSEESIQRMDDSQLGLIIKKQIHDYSSIFNTDEDITKYIFLNLLSFVKDNIIGENFIIVLPIGNLVVRVKFTSILNSVVKH